MPDKKFVPKDYNVLIEKSFYEVIKKFLPFFRPNAEEQQSLVGRIHIELQKDAHAQLQELKLLKETMGKELNKDQDRTLWISFEGIINPLLREFSQIERQFNNPSSREEERLSHLNSINHWIDRAKLWVSLCSKPSDREKMVQAVIEHTFHILDQRIDRDLKTLTDYKEHEVQLLGLGDEAIQVMRDSLEQDLSLFVQGLLRLKEQKPQDRTLSTLIQWKTQTDEKRTLLFNAALHKIDSHVSQAILPVLPEEERENLKELIHQIAHLENEAQMLQVQYQNGDFEEAFQRR